MVCEMQELRRCQLSKLESISMVIRFQGIDLSWGRHNAPWSQNQAEPLMESSYIHICEKRWELDMSFYWYGCHLVWKLLPPMQNSNSPITYSNNDFAGAERVNNFPVVAQLLYWRGRIWLQGSWHSGQCITYNVPSVRKEYLSWIWQCVFKASKIMSFMHILRIEIRWFKSASNCSNRCSYQ